LQVPGSWNVSSILRVRQSTTACGVNFSGGARHRPVHLSGISEPRRLRYRPSCIATTCSAIRATLMHCSCATAFGGVSHLTSMHHSCGRHCADCSGTRSGCHKSSVLWMAHDGGSLDLNVLHPSPALFSHKLISQFWIHLRHGLRPLLGSHAHHCFCSIRGRHSRDLTGSFLRSHLGKSRYAFLLSFLLRRSGLSMICHMRILRR
jgi:hypothetical protein